MYFYIKSAQIWPVYNNGITQFDLPPTPANYEVHDFLVSCTPNSGVTVDGSIKPMSRHGDSDKWLQVAHLSQTDCAAGWITYGQKWTTGTGRQYYTDMIGLPSTTAT